MKNIAIILLPLLFVLACNSQNSNEKQKSSDTSNVSNTDSVSNKEKVFTIKPQAEAKYPDIKSIPVPPGYERVSVEEGSFGEWLRNLNLKTENNDLYLYDGNLKYSQDLHFAVLKFDAGKSDLQQCADAVMRLRGEYLYAQHQYKDIHFNFLSDGKPRYFTQYGHGDKSYKKFRNYMNYIFSYANTASLKKELTPVKNPKNIRPGDVFIQSGRPYGHAVTVVDVAKNKEGDVIFTVSQSYMPAEEINIVKNLNNSKLSPWYKLYETPTLKIPEWEFEYSDLRRF
ncbi:MAG: hypothetical protein DRI94_07820 [Bacteroidetes bacterium]|nr:MAG: hypothetical protein DRI94_07820 [Bacteroidota bacterium]